MRNSIKKNLRKINNTRKSKGFSSKKINNRKSKNNTLQRVRCSRNGKIRGGNQNLINILYVLGQKNQPNQLQVIAMSKSIKNLHMFAKDLPGNLTFPVSKNEGKFNEFKKALENNMVIDTIELNNSSTIHNWQKVSLSDIQRLIEEDNYSNDNIDDALLHYTIDKSSQITGVLGAIYSNEVPDSDGQMMTEFGNFYDALVLLDNYEPLDTELEPFIEENKLSIKISDRVLIEKKRKERHAYLEQIPITAYQLCQKGNCKDTIFKLINTHNIPWKDILDSPMTGYNMKLYGFDPYTIIFLFSQNVKLIDFLKKGFNIDEINQDTPNMYGYKKEKRYKFSPEDLKDAIINSNLSVSEIMNKISYSVYNYSMPLSYLYENGATPDEVFKYSGYDYRIVLFNEKLSFDEYVDRMDKLCENAYRRDLWKTQWYNTIINNDIFKVYHLNDILKKCKELNLWSTWKSLFHHYYLGRDSYNITTTIEDQLNIEKKPLIYFIDILKYYKLHDELKSLLLSREFIIIQLKSGNVSLLEIINGYEYLKNNLDSKLNYSDEKRILEDIKYSLRIILEDEELNYSATDFKNNGISLYNVLKYIDNNDYKKYRPSKILEKGYTLEELVKSKYFSYSQLRSDFSLIELKNAGITIKDYIHDKSYTNQYLKKEYSNELIQAGYTAAEFKESGYADLPYLENYFTLEQLAQLYTIEELYKVYSIIELSKKFKLEDLLTVYKLEELVAVYKLEDLNKHFTLKDLVKVYKLEELVAVYKLEALNKHFILEDLVKVYKLDEIFSSGKYKYEDIKKFNKEDNKNLDKLLKDCKKSFLRKTNLECIYDPEKKIATNPTERY